MPIVDKRADGSYVKKRTAYEVYPAAGGADMQRVIYDTDGDGVVDDSEELEGLTWPHVDVRSHATFADAIDDIGATETTLLIPNQQNVAANKTVPANVTLLFLHGGLLNIAGGVTLAIEGDIQAGLYQIFEVNGTLSGLGRVESVFAEWFVTSGDGSQGTPWVIGADISGITRLHFPQAGYYQLGANWAVPSNARIRATSGAKLVTDVYSVSIEGSLSGTTSDLTASASRGDKTVDVANGALFSEGDIVEIEASPDEANNDAADKGPQRELNEVVSISTNTLTLEYPLGHNYPTGYGTEPKVTVLTTFKQDIEWHGLDITDAGLTIGYVDNLSIENCEMNALQGLDTASLHLWVANVRITDAIGSGVNALLHLHGVRFFNVSATTYGGAKDGARFTGCADGQYRVKVLECPQRGIRLYKCQHVNTPDSQILGTQTQTTNMELLLFDHSYHCCFTGTIEEINKTTLVNLFEFRGDSVGCKVINSSIHVHTTYPGWVKPTATGSQIVENAFYVYTSASLITLDYDTTPASNATLHIKNNKIYKQDGCTYIYLLRTAGNAELLAPYGVIELKGNYLERGEGGLVTLGGTGAGSALGILAVINNTTADGSGGSGSLIYLSGVPVTWLFAVGNCMETPGSRKIYTGDAASYIYLDGNRCGEIEIGVATAVYLGTNICPTLTIAQVSDIVNVGVFDRVDIGKVGGTDTLEIVSAAGGGVTIRESDDGDDAVVLRGHATLGQLEIYRRGASKLLLSGGGDSYIDPHTTSGLSLGHQGAPTGKVHIKQGQAAGAMPVATFEQVDASEEFQRFIGTAADGVLTQSIVAEGNQAGQARAGWLKVYVRDDGDQITDQAYFVPIYTLS